MTFQVHPDLALAFLFRSSLAPSPSYTVIWNQHNAPCPLGSQAFEPAAASAGNALASPPHQENSCSLVKAQRHLLWEVFLAHPPDKYYFALFL